MRSRPPGPGIVAPGEAERPLRAAAGPKRLNFFERYLTLWVAVCMIVGVAEGVEGSSP